MSEVRHSPSANPPSLGYAVGDGDLFSGNAGVWAWGPVINLTARTLASWLCALLVQHKGAWMGASHAWVRRVPVRALSLPRLPGGGAPCAWVSGVRGRALSLPQPPVHGAGGWGLLSVFCWHGGCGREDPSPTPQRTLLRAGFAPCGGGTRAHGKGHLVPPCAVSGLGHSPPPNPPSYGCAAGPLHRCFGCVVRA